MKIKLFLAAAIFLFFLLLTLPVAATEIQDINAVIGENNQVTVKGKLVPGEVKQVTVKITDPDGKLEYLDQKSSDAEGNFSFSYAMQTLIDGTYHVSVGGEEIAQLSTITLDTTKPVYTVYFDSNGGSEVASQDIEHGSVATEPVAPTKEGNSFAGWYTDELLENAYDFSTPVTADITLYAKWTAILTYTVTYNANDATSGNVPIDTNQYTYGATVTVLDNTGNLAKDGYNFASWNTLPDGSGTNYAAGTTFNMGKSDIILYARWSAQPVYTVTFDSNGGTAVTSQDMEHGSVATEPAEPTREGYIFAGWYTDAALTNSYDFSTPITANITLYAKWTAILTYTVTYDANEATNGSVPTDTNQYAQGATVTVLGNTGNLERSGYNFAGWNTSADGSGTNYAAGDTFSMGASDIIIYARWTEQPVYTVAFDSNGGSEVSSQNIEHGAVATEPTAPTKEGYSFDGWYSDALLENAYDFSTPVTADIILYAKWIEILTYTVTYEANEATTGSVPIDSYHYTQGATVTVLGNIGNLAKDGYNFAGWNTLADGSGTNYATGATFNMGTSNIILYARWTEQPAYTVTFNSNGGSVVPSQNIEHGAVATEPAAPTKEGYSFIGWYTDASLENAYDFSTSVTANITLYAKWTAGEPDECFIATAAYGSKLAPGVTILRQFRDKKLLTSIPGQTFVSCYYRVSPPIAEYIANNSFLKVLIRALLLPVIAVSYMVMQPWLLLVAVILVVLYYRRRMVYR